jgi:ADP-heptose:LPS heptosyltransferase
MWPSERFAELADKLIEDGKKVIFIDSKANEQVVSDIISMMKYKDDAINFAGKFSVKQATEVINNCDTIVATDSGMAHISAAQGVKTIVLFGCNSYKLWGPYGKGNISIAKYKKGCPYIDNINRKLIPDKLTKEQLSCMDAITVKDVYDKI